MGTLIKRPDEAERLRLKLRDVVFCASQVRDKLIDSDGLTVSPFRLAYLIESYWESSRLACCFLSDLPPWIVGRLNSLDDSHFTDNVRLAINGLDDWMVESRTWRRDTLGWEIVDTALIAKVESDGPPDFKQPFHVLRQADRLLRAVVVTEVDGVVQPETTALTLPSVPPPSPAADDPLAELPDDALMNHADIATKLGTDSESLRKRLERWRNKNADGWQEIADAKAREPRYLYRVGSIKHLLREAI